MDEIAVKCGDRRVTPERWSEIRKVFGVALETPKQERPQFLRSACGADDELRAEVERLLAGNEEPSWQSPIAKLFPVAVELAPGDTVAQYRITAKLGAGGMGVVYKAYDTRLRREVAIKTLPPGFAGDRDRIARFEREARAASALNHPNIVSVHEFGHNGDLSFIVTELVDGETLAGVIERGPLPLRKLIDVSAQICDGLTAAHSSGVIHRDLKPGNIMLSRDGRVKILDFGLARQNRADGFDGTTMDVSHPGMIMGTPGYMSPEQVRGGATDARSDIFSLGVILYEMASRQRPFRGTSSIEVMNAILKDDPPELPAASPPAFGRVVHRCLEKEPARRFQTTADLGFALHSLTAPPLPEKAPKSRRWLKWLALAIATTVTGGAIYWMGLPLRKPASPPEFSLRRLTNDERLSAAPAISPDGKLVTYSSNRADPDHFDIWVQQIDGGGAIRLTDDPANHWNPAFSADGSQIGFRSDRDKGGIYLVPTLGGEARELVAQGKDPRFSPDGRWLMYSTGQEIQVNGQLFIQSLSGGPPIQIGKGIMVCRATWSPDGRRILVWADCDPSGPPEGSEGRRSSVWVYDVEREELKRVYDPGLVRIIRKEVVAQWVDNPSRLLTWAKVADAFVFTATPVSADGTKITGAPQKLASVTDQVSNVSAASDGRMVFSIETNRFHAWGLPIDVNGHAVGPPKPLARGPEPSFTPVLSKDGLKLTFTFFRANGCALFYKNLTTEREREIYPDGDCNGPLFNSDGSGLFHANPAGIGFTPISNGLPRQIWNKRYALLDLSPDGKTLLFLKEYPDKPIWGLVWQLDLDSLTEKALLEDPELDAWQAHFSHDGRWVTFNASTKDGVSSRVYVAPFRKSFLPRSEWIEVTNGDWDDKPRFSADDKMIFFRSGANAAPHRLWAQRLTSDKRPDGNPVEVYSPDRRYVMDDDEIAVGPRMIAFDLGEVNGNVWLLEPTKGNPK